MVCGLNGSRHFSQGSAILKEVIQVGDKLLEKAMKKEGVRMCEAFIAIITAVS
jgi:hypothetical protein